LMLPELPVVTTSVSGVNELAGPEEIVSLPIWAAAPITRSFALVVITTPVPGVVLLPVAPALASKAVTVAIPLHSERSAAIPPTFEP